jgi:hypothetical protein
MKTKLFTTCSAVFFFVLFTGTKVFGFQEFIHHHEDHQSHHEDQDEKNQKEDCELCDKILLDLFSPYHGDERLIEIAEIPQQFYDHSIEEYTSETYSTELSIVLFSRPPPRV